MNLDNFELEDLLLAAIKSEQESNKIYSKMRSVQLTFGVLNVFFHRKLFFMDETFFFTFFSWMKLLGKFWERFFHVFSRFFHVFFVFFHV